MQHPERLSEFSSTNFKTPAFFGGGGIPKEIMKMQDQQEEEEESEEEESEEEAEEEEEEEEAEAEEEEEGESVEQFTYKNKNYYRDSSNQVYAENADGEPDDAVIGVWDATRERILFKRV